MCVPNHGPLVKRNGEAPRGRRLWRLCLMDGLGIPRSSLLPKCCPINLLEVWDQNRDAGERAPGGGLEPPSIRIQSPAFFQLNYPGTT